MKNKLAVIIPAAGTGKRMGGIHKQFLKLGEFPVIVHTLKKFQQNHHVDTVCLAVSKEKINYCRDEIVKRFGLTKVKNIVEGGKERQDSVYNALNNLYEFDFIMVHDAVRPFITNQIIEDSIKGAIRFGAVVVAIPEKDTIKETNDAGIITKTLNRSQLWRIQTPQTFRREILEAAFKKAYEQKISGTDEAYLVEQAGFDIRVVKGSEFNIKLTTKEDIELGELVLKRKRFVV